MGNKPKKTAELFLDKYYLQDPSEADLLGILGSEDIFCKKVTTSGYQGNLIREGKKGIVNINANITNKHKIRFIIAHELGHWLMHIEDELFACSSDDLNIWKSSTNKIEKEANQFASSFLMPENVFQEFIINEAPSVELFKAISNRFNVSITAGAIRFLEYSNTPCTLLFYHKGIVKWFTSSAKFKYTFYKKINQSPPPSASLTKRYFRNVNIPISDHVCLAKTWFPNNYQIKNDQYLNEIIFPMPKIDACITCIWDYRP